MARTTRQYSAKTIKLLFGSCGNECAEPTCTNRIIAAGTPQSDAAVIGHICHIYAAADNGPRGKPGLTEKQRNAPANLILLCGHHHPLVDKQWETYPAEMLIAWKKRHEAKFQKETAEALRLQAEMRQLAFLAAYSDEQINAEIERIRKARFLAGFPTKEAARVLAVRVDVAEFAGGSRETRARALAWSARLLALSETSGEAQILLAKAKALGNGEDATIAEAFLTSVSDKAAALALLTRIHTPAARSAALRIVTNQEGANCAIAWFDKAGLALTDLDSEGKLLYLMNALSTEEWGRAAAIAAAIADDDFREAPVLYHAVAMTELIQAVPLELRTAVMSQVLFEANSFPLASDGTALAARRRAAALFSKSSDFAQSMGVANPSNPDSDYALWLKLRDPRDHALGMEELRASMRDPAQSLRRLNLALQFGIKLDLAAIERQIEQRIALSGKGTADEALARFALAFAQGNPREAAEYIARHRAQLYEHLQKSGIQAIEIELLARGGLIDQANRHLAQAVADGMGEHEQRSLQRIIAEAAGDDPAAARRRLYEQTGALRDLVNLANLLEERKAWTELLPYTEALFARTGALEDASRIATALNAAAEYGKLYEFLAAHPDLVRQSVGLRTVWAWSLYREGRFDEARSVLKELSEARDDANDRALRVNLAIASGDWDELIAYTAAEWERREHRTAAELLAAGQLAQAVAAPHARDLVTAAAERSADAPAILAAAYFHATSAGWEQNATTSQWLSRAAALSGSDGPLQSMSMRELLDRKPEWDKREASVWQQLNAGQVPVFGAAHMLGRSLIDFMLLPSLVNLNEPDPRRRSIVYAYSGARPGFVVPKPERIALDLAAIITLARLDLLDIVLTTYADVVIPNTTLGWLFQERQKARFHQPSQIKEAHLLKRLIAAKNLNVLPPLMVRNQALDREVGAALADLLITVRAKMESDSETLRYVVRSAPVHRIGSLMEEEADLSAYADVLCSCQAVVAKVHAKSLLMAGEEEAARSYLKLHERSWPLEPAIADGAELYLDHLSVAYLRTVGVLDKLQAAGLTVFIDDSTDIEANRLIAFEALADRQMEVIETIRRSLSEGLRSGRVHAARSREVDEGEMICMHPTFAVLSMGENVDAFVVDDRFINRHASMIDKNKQTGILTTL
ncbi:HTH domain-containing protein [Methylocystis sp.]|uniref:HTH domain-containing protein n=1 Tax=Methylocystis sp. TaxID=1911079 RepID=UPI003DA5CD6A